MPAVKSTVIEEGGIDVVDYDEVAQALDCAWMRCQTAEEYLLEILHIWSQYGMVDGTWVCELAEAV